MQPTETRTKRPRRIAGWAAFGVMVLLGALLAFSFLSFAGPLVWPVVLVLGGFVIWARPPGRAAFGLITGVALFLLFVGMINIDSNPCASVGVIGADVPGDVWSCGGLDAKPWLIIGSTLFLAGTGLFVAARHRSTDA